VAPAPACPGCSLPGLPGIGCIIIPVIFRDAVLARLSYTATLLT
jgi:hypothetical protein